MARRQTDSELNRFGLLILVLMGAISCLMVYLCFSILLRPSATSSLISTDDEISSAGEGEDGKCCGGIKHLELWGDAVKWGANFKLNSSEQCCMACKGMCDDGNGACFCDSWVFCGDKQACGSKFGECWLKKQIDSLEPYQQDSGDHVMWTSGLVYGKEKGIIGLETEYGRLRVKLLPECAPHSVFYILELLLLRHCMGCHFYRAEGRGRSWDSEGNHVEHTSYGPPFAIIQGRLESYGTEFKSIPTEDCPAIRRGSVAWVDSGPDFLISLANHFEWRKAYTVFGFVLPEDMVIAEKIAQLPTKLEVWSNTNVAVLDKPVPLRFRKVMNVNTNRDTGSSTS